MNDREAARRFLDQLRIQTYAALGILPPGLDPSLVREAVNLVQETWSPKDRQNPQLRAILEEEAAHAMQSGLDDHTSEGLAKRQDAIEKIAAARVTGLDVGSRRPLVAYLQTGQLNAVSMRVPGTSGAYLVLYGDHMTYFTYAVSSTVVWAIPADQPDPNGMLTFHLDLPSVAQRIEATPEIVSRFVDMVVSYAVTGRIHVDSRLVLPPGYHRFVGVLRDSQGDFLLGHEYAHILLGHLETTATRKGVLPADDAEVLAYSWQQEVDADSLGMILSIQAGLERGDSVFEGFSGIGLFFDAVDVMDRAVALLETGDENARQLGSHPPSDMRKKRLRDLLLKVSEADPAAGPGIQEALTCDEVLGEIVNRLWEDARPVLLDLHRRGVPAANTWRTIARETGAEPTPAQ